MNDTTLSNFGFTPRYIEVVHTAQRQFFSLITPWHPKALQTNRGAHQSPQWNKRAVFEMYCLFYFWADNFPINNSFYIPKTENLSLSERAEKMQIAHCTKASETGETYLLLKYTMFLQI